MQPAPPADDVPSLPQVPSAEDLLVGAADPLAGTNTLTSGRGQPLEAASPEALLAALELFDDEGEADAAATAAPTVAEMLPVGAAWPVLAIVTPEGLLAHAVQPELGTTTDSRGVLPVPPLSCA